MADRGYRKMAAKHSARMVWILGGFYGGAYLLTSILKDPRPAMVLAGMAMVPLSVHASSLWRALLRGAGLGLVAGASIAMAMRAIAQPAGQSSDLQQMHQATLVYTVGTMLLCTVVSLAFALLARRRQKLIDQQWQRAKHRR